MQIISHRQFWLAIRPFAVGGPVYGASLYIPPSTGMETPVM